MWMSVKPYAVLEEIVDWEDGLDPGTRIISKTVKLYVNPEFVMSVKEFMGDSSIQFITGFNVSIKGPPSKVKEEIWG